MTKYPFPILQDQAKADEEAGHSPEDAGGLDAHAVPSGPTAS
jgi:hypothetical protein